MRINTIGLPVLDQQKALDFYTQKLGFVKKHDIPVGGGNRWLTVVAKDAQSGPELSLEPAPVHFEPMKVFQKALFEAGIPYTQFDVDDVESEYKRLIALGVAFSMKPTEMGTVKVCVLEDACGNNIQLVQML